VRETFQSTFQLANSNLEERTFRGYASVFNTPVDTWMPTVIEPGAFTKTLQENASRVRILYQHDTRELIGKPLSMRETAIGLEVEGKISKTVRGDEVLELMRDEVATDLSIGFDCVKVEIEERDGMLPLRHVKEVKLFEFSVVTWGANAPAKITECNSAELTDAVERMLRHETRESVREALARIVTERTSLTTTGSVAAEAALTDDAALARFIEQLGKSEPDDFFRLALGPVLYVDEQHKGRVLSAKNKKLVESAIDALTALIAAAEPDDDQKAAASLTADRETFRAAMLRLRQTELHLATAA
jgi:hypothetical protein